MAVMSLPRWVSALCTIGALLLSAGTPVAAQGTRPWTPDRKLQQSLERLTQGFRGDVGIYVQHLKTGRGAAIRADELFPTASMIKVPILAMLHARLAAGSMRMQEMQVRGDSAIYAYPDDVGEVGNLKAGTKITTGVLAFLMISTSDNSAAIWLQSLVGGGSAINAWLSENGFDSTRVNSRTPGREADRTKYGWGQTTPREMARLMARIREGSVVNPAASEEMYRALTRIYWNGEALSEVPPWVQTASKQGSVDKSRSEVLLVNAPSGDYVVSIITKNQLDERYEPDNEGHVLLRKVSAAVWKHFEPKSPYTPAAGTAALKP